MRNISKLPRFSTTLSMPLREWEFIVQVLRVHEFQVHYHLCLLVLSKFVQSETSNRMRNHGARQIWALHSIQICPGGMVSCATALSVLRNLIDSCLLQHRCDWSLLTVNKMVAQCIQFLQYGILPCRSSLLFSFPNMQKSARLLSYFSTQFHIENGRLVVRRAVWILLVDRLLLTMEHLLHGFELEM